MACSGQCAPTRVRTGTAVRPAIRSMYTPSMPSRTASWTFWWVASYRSCMNGRATSRSPVPRGHKAAISTIRSPIRYRPSSPRSSPPHRSSSLTSRWVVVSGSPVRRDSSESVWAALPSA